MVTLRKNFLSLSQSVCLFLSLCFSLCITLCRSLSLFLNFVLYPCSILIYFMCRNILIYVPFLIFSFFFSFLVSCKWRHTETCDRHRSAWSRPCSSFPFSVLWC